MNNKLYIERILDFCDVLLGMRLIRFIFAYFLKMSLHADIRQFVFRVSACSRSCQERKI